MTPPLTIAWLSRRRRVLPSGIRACADYGLIWKEVTGENTTFLTHNRPQFPRLLLAFNRGKPYHDTAHIFDRNGRIFTARISARACATCFYQDTVANICRWLDGQAAEAVGV